MINKNGNCFSEEAFSNYAPIFHSKLPLLRESLLNGELQIDGCFPSVIVNESVVVDDACFVKDFSIQELSISFSIIDKRID